MNARDVREYGNEMRGWITYRLNHDHDHEYEGEEFGSGIPFHGYRADERSCLLPDDQTTGCLFHD